MSELEDLLGRTLRDPARALPAPADPLPAIRARAGRQRRNTALGVVAVALVVAATLAVPAAVTRLNRAAPTATTPGGLLPWAPRGELTGDADLVRAAERVWRSGATLPPTGPARTLWAGRVGLNRVVLLQAPTADGPAVVQVMDRDGALRLVAADLLPAPTPAALQLVDVASSEYEVRLLAAPDAYSVEVYGRSSRSGGLRGERGDDGLVLVDKVIPERDLAVALDIHGQALTSGVLPAAGRLATTPGPVTVVASSWDPGQPQPLEDSTVSDGALLSDRLGGPVEIAQLSNNNIGFGLRAGSAAFPRFYEVRRNGTRYLVTLVAVQDAQRRGKPYCLRLEPLTGTGPAAVVLRCALPGFGTGALAVLPRSEVRSGELIFGPFRRSLAWPGAGENSLENTGPDFPTGAGRLELTDTAGRALPPIELPAYRP